LVSGGDGEGGTIHCGGETILAPIMRCSDGRLYSVWRCSPACERTAAPVTQRSGELVKLIIRARMVSRPSLPIPSCWYLQAAVLPFACGQDAVHDVKKRTALAYNNITCNNSKLSVTTTQPPAICDEYCGTFLNLD
jgi:hypothetical protein